MNPNSEHVTSTVTQIIAGLRHKYAALNGVRYEAAWSDSWVYCRCFHAHPTLIDATKCGMSKPGFYVLAFDERGERELTAEEDRVVRKMTQSPMLNSPVRGSDEIAVEFLRRVLRRLGRG